MITIIDYGVGNLASVQNMLKKCGVECRISSDPEEISSAAKVILPGVGAFDAAMIKIDEGRLRDPIVRLAEKGVPVLGICLGAQLLLDRSEEGALPGLSLIPGSCKKFQINEITPLRVPHMGWSDVFFPDRAHPLVDFGGEQPRFYFTHSYYLNCRDSAQILATCNYGIEFTCGIARENIMGVQFHPEKSHAFGAKLLTNFAMM